MSDRVRNVKQDHLSSAQVSSRRIRGTEGGASSSSMRLEILLTFNYTLNSLTRAQKLQLESFGEVRTVKAGEYVWKTDAAAAYSVLVESGFLSYEGRGGQLMKSLR